ncbi:unnamed protein product [Alopecurus aequalis]
MKWLPFMSTFVINHMVGLIRTGVRTDKGFKEVHLTLCAKALFVHCGTKVTSTQVYNNLRKWRQRIKVSKLRDLSGAQWCEETFTIILAESHYQGHIKDHPKDAEFLNKTILNYTQMQIIFSFGLATGKFAMGSGDPLSMPLPEDAETQQESDIVILDGPPRKQGKGRAQGQGHGQPGKRKRGALGDDEIRAFSSMTGAVKEVAQAIRESKTTKMHPDLYNAIMDTIGFTEEDLMVALGHLVYKAQGVSFVGMLDNHKTL